MEAAASAAAIAVGAPEALHPLPDWLLAVEDNPAYRWAISGWRRAASVPGAWFDAAKAEKIVAAWPTIFRLTEDRFHGKPFNLLLWQGITLRLLVGWKKPVEILDETTAEPRIAWVRIFRRLDLWIPRKNGKSEFLAGLGVLFFVLEKVHGAQAFVFGRDENQGRIPFKKMKAIIEVSKGLMVGPDGSRRVVNQAKSIFVPETGGLCELLSGKPDGKHGRSPTVIVGDEIHEWLSRDLADTLREGTGTRLQPIELYASTAGVKTAKVGYDWFEESMEILDGVKDDPFALIVFFGADQEDDWQDEATWRKANPSIGMTPTWDYMRIEAAKARGKPALEAKFKCYHLNQWVDHVSSWIPAKVWRAAARDREAWRQGAERFRGRRCVGAIDVSAVRDLTALVWLFEPLEERRPWEVLPLFWIPETTLDERQEQDKRVNWKDWVAQGALRKIPGDVIDLRYVADAVLEGMTMFDVARLGFDAWGVSQLQIMLQDDGVPVEIDEEPFLVNLRQGHRTLAAPTVEFERRVFQKLLDHGGHPVLDWMVRHCGVRFDQNLNYVPDKAGSKDKIDGVIASVMATYLTMEEPGEGPSVYEDRGIVEIEVESYAP
ncbi:terminase large subunit [Bosea spartocytisi]|uniref:terminase large subunit n=1 Tax=Bosea spartocytisi TaxID=2773451 RepID=UPI0021A9CBA7|nr:terminase TerL endonuclease subunit [Bosea spartocytisi]MCT4474207.1 terminase large subunit [Bosea spartocytisi]